jgi:hypothetical protein
MAGFSDSNLKETSVISTEKRSIESNIPVIISQSAATESLKKLAVTAPQPQRPVFEKVLEKSKEVVSAVSVGNKDAFMNIVNTSIPMRMALSGEDERIRKSALSWFRNEQDEIKNQNMPQKIDYDNLRKELEKLYGKTIAKTYTDLTIGVLRQNPNITKKELENELQRYATTTNKTSKDIVPTRTIIDNVSEIDSQRLKTIQKLAKMSRDIERAEAKGENVLAKKQQLRTDVSNLSLEGQRSFVQESIKQGVSTDFLKSLNLDSLNKALEQFQKSQEGLAQSNTIANAVMTAESFSKGVQEQQNASAESTKKAEDYTESLRADANQVEAPSTTLKGLKISKTKPKAKNA